MKVLAVIPARLGASRLPRKPLRLLGGAPMVVRVLERVERLGVADAVLVATDHQEVADAVHASGGRAELTRQDHPSGTDRIAEVVTRPAWSTYDVILNVQGDEPFVSADAVRGALDMVVMRGFDLGTAAARASAVVQSNPHIVKVVCASDARAMYFSRAPIPWCRDAGDAGMHADLVRQHIGVYAYRHAALLEWVGLPEHPLERVERLEQLRALAAGLRMGVAVVAEAPDGGIDTEDDLARANARWQQLQTGRS